MQVFVLNYFERNLTGFNSITNPQSDICLILKGLKYLCFGTYDEVP